jgi:hypothetical protein
MPACRAPHEPKFKVGQADRGSDCRARIDIRALLRMNRESLNLPELREYFRLFDREPLLDELLDE